MTLPQLGYADHKKQQWPGAMESRSIKALNQKKSSQREQHHRSNITSTSNSTIRSVGWADHSPASCDLPYPDRKQDYRPEALDTEEPKTHGMHQEKHSQPDQHHRCRRYSRSVYFLAPAEGPSQPERIRRRLYSLQPLRKTVLAINHSFNVALAICAQRLTASTAVGHCCNIVVRGAVHENLL